VPARRSRHCAPHLVSRAASGRRRKDICGSVAWRGGRTNMPHRRRAHGRNSALPCDGEEGHAWRGVWRGGWRWRNSGLASGTFSGLPAAAAAYHLPSTCFPAPATSPSVFRLPRCCATNAGGAVCRVAYRCRAPGAVPERDITRRLEGAALGGVARGVRLEGAWRTGGRAGGKACGGTFSAYSWREGGDISGAWRQLSAYLADSAIVADLGGRNADDG